MYTDDLSIHFENVSDLAFKSKNNSIPNFNLKNNDENVETTKEVVQRNDRQNTYIQKDFDLRSNEKEVNIIKF